MSQLSTSHQVITAVFGFSVLGLARYFSHAELMRVFQRAAVRAGWPLQFSEGFNPRPRVSLPFPKPVGVETEGDLAQIRLLMGRGEQGPGPDLLASALRGQLPEGIPIEKAWILHGRACYHPVGAECQLFVSDRCDLNQIRSRAIAVLQQESINLDRPTRPDRRSVDVRPFIESIDLNDWICVRYRIIDGATIRVPEMLGLLGLTFDDLCRPIRRRSIQWTMSTGRKVDIDQ